jgi:SseB protein N-terminal domain
VTEPDIGPAAAPWLPGNDVEVELVSALVADDRTRFFRTVRAARWFLPALPPGDRGPRYLTRDLYDETYLLVFTSVRSLVGAVGGVVEGFLITGYDELSTHWPAPYWRLAINPGTPIDGWVTMDVLAAAAAGARSVPTLAEARIPDPATDADDDDARDEFLTRLLRAALLVPVQPEAPSAFRPAEHDGIPAVEVFTSTETLHRSHPGGIPTITRTLPELLVDWPDDQHALVIDAGSDAPVVIPGDRVGGLLLWGAGETPPPDGSAEAAGAPRTTDNEYIGDDGRRTNRR